VNRRDLDPDAIVRQNDPYVHQKPLQDFEQGQQVAMLHIAIGIDDDDWNGRRLEVNHLGLKAGERQPIMGNA
jgi:hypothetical protein